MSILRGVGSRRAEQLERLGIRTVRDLLYFLPRSYAERPPVRPIAELEPDSQAAVIADVVSTTIRRRRRNQRDLLATIADASGEMEILWFHQPYLQEQLTEGTRIAVWGSLGRGRPLRFFAPEFEVLPATAVSEAPAAAVERRWLEGGLEPIYRLTAGISQKQMRRLVAAALAIALSHLEEPLDTDVRDHAEVGSLADALRVLHAPEDTAGLREARERLVFDEFLTLLLALGRWRRTQSAQRQGHVMRGGEGLRAARHGLPFQLTRAQRMALTAILDDMASPRVMHRLLEGDVGAGKTVVALLAAVTAADAGRQTALMVPTEILAHQHVRTAAELTPMLRTALLTGSAPDRRRVARAAAAGELDLVIGTQALFAASVEFQRLGLVIVDEQHRFGVAQRAALHAKGEHPDMLVMTATPIPRSLALTCFGDLDLTVIDGLPPGRRLASTYLAEPSHRDRVLRYVDQRIGEGGQAIVITPRIDSSETSDLIAATQCLDSLRRHPQLGGRRLDLLHGRMSPEDRAAVLDALRRGEIDLLVATTIIEVGLDVPGLSLVVIEHPERFGLSQLHQLRGRVGRGQRRGECILQLDDQTSVGARDRLRLFARTQDGFQVATLDLETRGIGDLIGHRQHGFDGFQVADPVRDRHLLERARKLASRLLTEDPELEQHLALRDQVLRVRQAGWGPGSCSSESEILAG